MKCGFCAVQTLEPTYIPYMDIKEKIAAIDKKFGPKKDLLLMDNNVLRSNHFDQIIDDIIEAGWFDPEDLTQLPTLAFSADKFIITKYHQMMKEQGDITKITLEGHSVYGV